MSLPSGAAQGADYKPWSLKGWTDEAAEGPLLLGTIQYPSTGKTGRKGPLHTFWAFHKGYHAPPDKIQGSWGTYWKNRRDKDTWSTWDKNKPWLIVRESSRGTFAVHGQAYAPQGDEWFGPWLVKQEARFDAVVTTDLDYLVAQRVEEGKTGPVASPAETIARLVVKHQKQQDIKKLQGAISEIEEVLGQLDVLKQFQGTLKERLRKKFET